MNKYEEAWKRLYRRYSGTRADTIADLKVMHEAIEELVETRKKLDLALFIFANSPTLPADMNMDKDAWESWLYINCKITT